MDVLDQFTSYAAEGETATVNGNEWASEYPVSTEQFPVTEATNSGTSTSSASNGDFGATYGSDPSGRARQFTQQLAATLGELTRCLDDGEAERQQMVAERQQMETFIAELQEHRAAKDRFTETLKDGGAGSISNDDLTTIQGMMETLTQDPDRLTVLFTVVQQASKLAAIVGDYSQLRQMAYEG